MKMRDKKNQKMQTGLHQVHSSAYLEMHAYRSIHILRAGYTFSPTAAEIAVIEKLAGDRYP